MKWVFIVWLIVFFVSIVFWGYLFIKLVIKTERWAIVSAKLIFKYFMLMLLCMFPAAATSGVLNIEAPFLVWALLAISDVLIVVLIIFVLKIDKRFSWFLLFPGQC